MTKLESLGVVCKLLSTASWDMMFDLLCKYKEREGHANAPQSHKEDGENLGSWLGSQRKFYRTEKREADRVNKLEPLGVVWNMR